MYYVRDESVRFCIRPPVLEKRKPDRGKRPADARTTEMRREKGQYTEVTDEEKQTGHLILSPIRRSH